MGMLAALEARLGEDAGEGSDGYYVRTHDDSKLGPITGAHATPACRSAPALTACASLAEAQFFALRDSPDVSRVASAWRVAGGTFYKVRLDRRVICDVEHACSCRACGHTCELVILLVCAACTAGAFCLINVDQLRAERERSGEGPWRLLQAMCVLTVVMVFATVRKLCERWNAASTEVFVSEV